MYSCTFWQVFEAFRFLLSRASTQSGLRECLESNSISELYLPYIRKDIDEYIVVRPVTIILFLAYVSNGSARLEVSRGS
jgi:hypothetical protein